MTGTIDHRVARAVWSGLPPVCLTLPLDTYMALVAGLLLLAVAPLVVVAYLKAPRRGLILLLMMAVLLPVDVATGTAPDTRPGGAFSLCFLLAAGLCAAWLLRSVILHRRLTLDSSRVVVAALLFVSISVLSFTLGQFPWFPTSSAPMRAQVGGLAIFVVSGGVFLMVGHEVASLGQLRRLTWVFLGTSAVALTAMVVPGSEFRVGRASLTNHGSVGSLFFTWLVAMSLSQATFNRQLSPLKRALLVMLGAGALGRGLLLTYSWTSGWVPPLAAAGVVLLFRFPRAALCAALLLTAPVLFLSGATWDALMKSESWSWMTRVEAMKVVGQVIERNPWLGFGPANYHYYTPLFPILGYNIRFSSHNNYLDLLAQIGVVGLLAFAWFSAEAGRLALTLRARLTDGFGRAYAVGVIAGLFGSLVAGLLADWVVPFVYNVGIIGFRSSLLFWFFLGGLLALRRLTGSTVPADVRGRKRVHQLALTRA